MNQTIPTTGFSVAAYGALLDALEERDYQIVDYPDARTDARHLILRHDVDVCVERALAMAEFEAARGASATYFFLLRTPLYNLLDAIDSVKHIAELGHRIGLHFDASLYAESDRQTAIARECDVLENISGEPVEMVSFHRPAKELLNYPDPLAGRLHAYMPRFFSEIGYSSDSRGGWYHGHPLQHEAVVQGRALQLLTHPIWWIAEENEDAATKLRRLVIEREKGFRESLAEHITPYQKVLRETA